VNSETRINQGLMWFVSASPRMTTAAVPGSSPTSVAQVYGRTLTADAPAA
jgi:hypothetical protein